MWARVMPTSASPSQRQSRPGSPIASKAATRPETRVMGRTAARVTTSQRVTASTGASGGGFVVRRAYAHDDSLERVLTSVITESYARCGPSGQYREIAPTALDDVRRSTPTTK